jgi:phosphatidylethanolamine-binding protein (PEBP) family uncharacterized protein
MKSRTAALFLTLAVLGCSGGSHESTPTAFDRAPSKQPEKLKVTSNAVVDGKITAEFTSSGAGAIPTIYWTAPPAKTQEIEVLMEDPDAPGGSPYVHMLIEGFEPTARSTASWKGIYGPSSKGDNKYAPVDPPGGETHHYHFEVFALDAPVGGKPLSRHDLLKTMAGHIIKKGELVATFAKP